MLKKFWPGNLKARHYLEGFGVDGRLILESILQKYIGRVWTGLIWLRIGTCGGLL
jgi:hypothetical protein